jgi:hypothetical protein
MTEIELKARKIVISFQFQELPLMFDVAKKCAIISVNFHIKEEKERCEAYSESDCFTDYWEKVLIEINKL